MATCHYSGPYLKIHQKSKIHKNYCCNDLNYELINMVNKNKSISHNCVCGGKLSYTNKWTHLNSKKHNKFVESKYRDMIVEQNEYDKDTFALKVTNNKIDKYYGYNDKSKNGFNSKTVTGGFLLPCFDVEQRTIMYICGQSGSGKTTYAYNLAKLYLEMFKDAQIFMFSIKTSDKSIDGIQKLLGPDQYYGRININETFGEKGEGDPLDLSYYENSLCIFDDYEAIEDKDVKKKLFILRQRMTTVGRDKHIHMCIISHLIIDTKYSDYSRQMCLESHYFIISSKTIAKQLESFLKNYIIGNNKKKILGFIDNVKKYRFFTIYKNEMILMLSDIHNKSNNKSEISKI